MSVRISFVISHKSLKVFIQIPISWRTDDSISHYVAIHLWRCWNRVSYRRVASTQITHHFQHVVMNYRRTASIRCGLPLKQCHSSAPLYVNGQPVRRYPAIVNWMADNYSEWFNTWNWWIMGCIYTPIYLSVPTTIPPTVIYVLDGFTWKDVVESSTQAGGFTPSNPDKL